MNESKLSNIITKTFGLVIIALILLSIVLVWTLVVAIGIYFEAVRQNVESIGRCTLNERFEHFEYTIKSYWREILASSKGYWQEFKYSGVFNKSGVWSLLRTVFIYITGTIFFVIALVFHFLIILIFGSVISLINSKKQ